MLKKKISILVTGGAGYIGSHIVEHLIKKRFQVIILDNLKTGSKKLVNKKSIFIKGDINNQKLLKKIFDKYNIYTIIHLAGLIDVIESHKNKKKYYRNNVLGTLNLLKSIKVSSVKNFIFSSSAGVYGNINKSAKETMKTKPINNYASMKLKSEKLIKKYSQNYNFNYAILRYFNVAGASKSKKIGQISRGDQLFKNLSIASLKKNPKINIYGNDYRTKDKTCIRDYIHVSDIAKIHILVLNKINKDKKSITLNCGYGRGISVLEAIKEFQKQSKKRFNIYIKKKRKGDMEQIVANISKIKKFINWKPKKNSLNLIVKSCINWERKLNYTK